MKFLITGAGGQIGRELVAAFAAEGHELIAADLRPFEQRGVAGERWVALDVRDREQVFELLARERPGAIFHLAAVLSARGESDPQLTYDVNQTGTYNLLEGARIHGVSRFIFPSTIAVYGPGLPDPTPDDVPLHPTTMYGVTKVAGELLCEYYRRRYEMDIRGLRFPGLISASLPGGGSSDYALFMYVDGVRRGRYEAFCRPDTRIPLMYMDDALRALRELFDAPRERLRRCVYNIAAFSPRADEVAASVARALGDVHFSFAPNPVKQGILDSWPSALDDACARADWDWRPRFDLDQMTEDLIPKIRALLAERADALDHGA
ncbi:NAD-dependent epimerase/dehydratase family protein [Haliangium ochraceum]|uniref:NAD-dependent epimerase/dehydratase n=1 Tax=Haliangium ochraceum (strain DSM 14365 / JCM 11303 / SMP-2) TaxID=502025 RepID=D0LRT9_HALO1|nr:NAD-dependent epimerase/dehydratase family protein [Haliangium ochraceum]ACY19081.1 NAD-dependent epimerase/dehydratase [Haliangium ochraceum DSM 14365]